MKDNFIKWIANWLINKIQLPQWAFWTIASALLGANYAIGNYNEMCGGCLQWSATTMTAIAFIAGLFVQARPTDDKPKLPSK